MKKIEDQTRRDIAAFLPEAIETALESYRQFSLEQITSDEEMPATRFKAHHDACKVALAHIKLLVDLAKWANLPDAGIEAKSEHDKLAGLITAAQCELKERGV